MFKKKNTKTNEDVVTASGVTISPALAEIIERKKNGLPAPAKKTKEKKGDVKDTSDIPDEFILIKRKKLAPTISMIIDRDIRDKAGAILKSQGRTMTEFVLEHLNNLINGENK